MLKKQPAALAGPPASKSRSHHQPDLDSEAQSPSKAQSANFPPGAEPRPAPDDRGEDDLTYFVRRPSLLQRVRFAFAGEFAIEPSFVVIEIQRDLTGWPRRDGAKRHLIFSGYGEGRA